jgi:2-phosphoglycerate kinase
MRGILVHSLVSRGVPFSVAFETAEQIHDRIAGREQIKREDLARFINELLGDRYDLGSRLPPLTAEPTRVIDPEGGSQPFSKGILALSLKGAGLEPSDAYDVARELEGRLLQEERREIARAELRELVTETIERTHGDLAAERYWVWHQVRHMGQPIFVLLGGSTGVGKTSVAVEVAQRLDIARVHSTDLIRQIMRLMFSPDLMPEIHCSTYEAAQVLKPELRGAANALIIGFREQAQKVAVGIHALLDRAVEENTSLIGRRARCFRGGRNPRSRGAPEALHPAIQAGSRPRARAVSQPFSRDHPDSGSHPGRSGSLRGADYRQRAEGRDDPLGNPLRHHHGPEAPRFPGEARRPMIGSRPRSED